MGIQKAEYTEHLNMTARSHIDFVERWVHDTEGGKKWLADMAATVGVPLQLSLPFKEGEDGQTAS